MMRALPLCRGFVALLAVCAATACAPAQHPRADLAQAMAHLVETLLWLGKDVAELPPSTEVDIEPLLREIIHA